MARRLLLIACLAAALAGAEQGPFAPGPRWLLRPEETCDGDAPLQGSVGEEGGAAGVEGSAAAEAEAARPHGAEEPAAAEKAPIALEESGKDGLRKEADTASPAESEGLSAPSPSLEPAAEEAKAAASPADALPHSSEADVAAAEGLQIALDESGKDGLLKEANTASPAESEGLSAPSPSLEPAAEETKAAATPADALPHSSEAGVAAGAANVSWYEGFFISMLQSRLVMLSDRLFVLCYVQAAQAGCIAADGESNATERLPYASGEIARHPKLLAPLPWSAPLLFHEGPVERLEVERLGSGSFVVCFQEWGGSISCCAGAARHGAFGNVLPLGPGRLVSATVAGAGRRVAVCLEREERGAVACSWVDVREEGNERPQLRLSDGEGFAVSL